MHKMYKSDSCLGFREAVAQSASKFSKQAVDGVLPPLINSWILLIVQVYRGLYMSYSLKSKHKPPGGAGGNRL